MTQQGPGEVLCGASWQLPGRSHPSHRISPRPCLEHQGQARELALVPGCSGPSAPLALAFTHAGC